MSGAFDQPEERLADLDPTARALLPVLRHVLVTLERPESQAWRLAFSSAARGWGEARGLALAYRAQSFVVMLSADRPQPLSYNDPLDPIDRDGLTTDELLILGLLTAFSRDDELAARAFLARLVAFGPAKEATLRAARDLADALDPMGPAPVSQHRPALRLVS